MPIKTMKKLLLTILTIASLFLPSIAFAQVTAPAGGTGLSTYSVGDMLYSAAVNPIRFTRLLLGAEGTCLQVSGGIPAWLTCAAGGSGGGTFSTTTSQVSGQFINYPNNATDIVCIGSTATTTCEAWFDPNAARYVLTGTTPRLGLGTTSPPSIFSIYGATPVTTITDTTNSSSAVGVTAATPFNFISNDTSSSLNGLSRLRLDVVTDNEFYSTFGLSLKTRIAGVDTSVWNVDNLGNQGIGSTSPYSRLSIYGVNNETGAPLVDVFRLASLASTSVFRIDANGKIQDGNGKTVSN